MAVGGRYDSGGADRPAYGVRGDRLHDERVVITGMGLASGEFETPSDLWAGLHDVSAPRLSSRFAAANVLETPIAASEFSVRERSRLARSTRLAILAARRAMSDSSLVNFDSERAGSVIATASNGARSLVEECARFDDPDEVTRPYLSCRATGSQRASAVAMDLGFHGVVRSPSTACAAGNDAIADAFELIRSGRCDVVLAGGTESPLSGPWVESMANLRVVARDGRCQPFDQDRHGFMMAEAAAVLVIESASHAAARSAQVLAEILGWESTCDAFHISRPEPSGIQQRRSVSGAIRHSGLKPGDIGAYFAHGTGTVGNDVLEASMVTTILPDIPVVASKGLHGHPFAASAVLEAIIAITALKVGALPPTWGLAQKDPACGGIDLVTAPRRWTPAAIVSASFGLGGVNTAVVISPWLV